ncbi:carbohydrate ABC transporter permease [Bradyrhizobium sp.]|uniref:carbohydrate ABC transporter permease n=1 Tax=Bradyrhizobium sp. TaxID=376 RepID=UPI0039E54876
MILPAVIMTLAMVVFPLGFAIQLSLGGGSPSGFSGANYQRLVVDPVFWSALKITLGLFAAALVLQLVLGTALALLLNRFDVVRGLVRTAILSPFMLPPVVVGMIAIVTLDPGLGAANWVLQSVGLPPFLWLASPQWSLLVVALIDTWQWTPFVALIVLGGLQALPSRVYEAAEIDGAVGIKRFWFITLPLLGPTLLTAAVLRTVDLLRFFDIIYITTQGGPGNATTTLNIYAYKLGFDFMDIGYASAIMISLATIVFGSVLFFAALRRKVAW